MTWLYAGLALLSGAALALQVGLNNGLRERMAHPVPAALTSFATGTLALFAFALVLRPGWPKGSNLAIGPWWIWLGGVVGASYMIVTVTFSNRLGAAGWLGVVVTGQVLTSVLLDHFGLVGFAVHPVSPWRVVGVGLLLAGAAIVLRT
jgi:bacterial/archaeal transporter family-2 protein